MQNNSNVVDKNGAHLKKPIRQAILGFKVLMGVNIGMVFVVLATSGVLKDLAGLEGVGFSYYISMVFGFFKMMVLMAISCGFTYLAIFGLKKDAPWGWAYAVGFALFSLFSFAFPVAAWILWLLAGKGIREPQIERLKTLFKNHLSGEEDSAPSAPAATPALAAPAVETALEGSTRS